LREQLIAWEQAGAEEERADEQRASNHYSGLGFIRNCRWDIVPGQRGLQVVRFKERMAGGSEGGISS